jgi:hypothetical protein
MDVRLFGLEDRRYRGHRYTLSGGRYGELCVHFGDFIHHYLRAGLLLLAKTLRVEADAVRSRRQCGKPIDPGRVGDRSCGHASLTIQSGDLRPGNNGAAGIGYRATDAAVE